MALQSTVNIYNAAGIIGDLAFDGPIRAMPYNLDGDAAYPNVIGRMFTIVSGANPEPSAAAPNAGTARAGGTGAFAGLLVNTKAYVTAGVSGNALDPTLTLPDYTIGEIAQMGEFWVAFPAAAEPGDLVYFDNTTGVIGTTAPTGAATGAATASATLTVSALSAGVIGIGSKVYGTDGNGVEVIALGSGTGGNGTYTLNKAVTVAGAITFTSVAPSGKTLAPNTVVSHYSATGAGIGVIKLTN